MKSYSYHSMSNQNSFPILAYQTGPDESYLIGTKEELLSFAQKIVSAVEESKPGIFFGHAASVKYISKDILDSKGEVDIDAIVLVANSQAKDEIFNSIYNS